MESTKHIESQHEEFFNNIQAIDWEGDLVQLSRNNERILRDFSKDRALFKRVLLNVPNDDYLWSKCEEDIVEDKIVLWDDMRKGIRIRLRMSTAPQQRLAHCHRFSFTNLVLKGEYLHWFYHTEKGFDASTKMDDVKEVWIHEDKAGDCFTIHHEALHSSPFSNVETVSLVLRGNPLKDRAPVMFKEARGRNDAISSANKDIEVEPKTAGAGDFFWRVGEEKESPERRIERRMSIEKFRYWVERLEDLRIV